MKNLSFFMHNNIIMNWSNLRKCILILTLASGTHILWVAWKIYILKTPELWRWINLPILKIQLILNSISLIVFLILIIPCYLFEGKKWAEIVLPYVVISVFILSFFQDAYIIGLFSPATITGFICVSGVGLLLFQRKIVYPPLIFATAIFLVIGWLTLNTKMPYAPLFNTNLMYQDSSNSSFWVSCMAIFIIPILIISLILSEILLIQRRYRESHIEKLSQIDPLTNLHNRRSFNEHLRRINYARGSYAIIILDLDHFKSINDLYGHRIGDEALKQVASVLTNNVRDSDIVARFGGEEFIILLQDTPKDKAFEIAERCRQSLKDVSIFINAADSIQLTASFGVAISNTTYDFEQIIHYADQALYQAKQQGRDQVQAYHQG